MGNPGKAYRRTRHNTGYRVLDALAAQFSIPIRRHGRGILFGTGRIEGHAVVLAKPTAYMNRSGPPVRRLCEDFNISKDSVLVIHDDIDLELGNLKIKEKGGDGGHKGVRSLMDAFGDDRFIRVRVGIGRPKKAIRVTDFVLQDFDPEEAEILDEVVTRAKEAVVCILCHGTKEGMNRFNCKSTRVLREPKNGGENGIRSQ